MHITIDGTDFRIKEPSPFSPLWLSHKFNGPGVCIAIGWIVWVQNCFRCGSYSDNAITGLGLSWNLDAGERCIVDKGYHSCFALTPCMGTELFLMWILF